MYISYWGGETVEKSLPFYRGCLLGMAVGDAMGYAIDGKTWAEIQEAYGPNGLLGYDLQEFEYAQITSYTQFAAFLCNGLLLSVSRGKVDYLRYAKLSIKEWLRSQHFYRDPETSYCWLAKLPQFRRKQCRDARMLDTLRLDSCGSMQSPKNNNAAPGAITSAVAVGLFYNHKRLSPEQVGTLSGELVALTHGNPEAFLSGVVLAYTITGILQEPSIPLADQFQQAIAVMDGQFRSQFFQAEDLALQLRRAIALAKSSTVDIQEGMEQLGCMDAPQCLAGAMYACLLYPNDFDSAIITAVNHSGMSAAVGAITGAILGAKLGEEALPDFYLESLDCVEPLQYLAEDMLSGAPALSVFDDTWDHKYVQGLPPEGLPQI